MGCGGSKDSREGATTIESEMKNVGIQKYDDFFGNASTILSNAEDIREGLQDQKEEMEELSNVAILKEPHLVDAVQAWFWCLSANGGGKISKSELSIEEEAPYVVLNASEYPIEVISFETALKTYLKTVIECPEKFNEIFEKFQEIADQAPSMGESLKDDASGLNPLQLGRATAACAKNIGTIASGLKKLNFVKDALQNASKDLPHLLKQSKDLIANADEVGKVCAEQKKFKIAECMEHSQKEKKNPEELKQMKAACKGKKKGKKNAKGGHSHGSGKGQHTHGKKEEHKE